MASTTRAAAKEKKKRKKHAEKKTNRYTELFQEEEKKKDQNTNGGGLSESTEKDRPSTANSDEENDTAQDVALFDHDLYGRKVADPHAAGFGRAARRKLKGRFLDDSDAENESPGDDGINGREADNAEDEEGDESWSENEDDEDDDLESALFNEWDSMALERARTAADAGYGYFGGDIEPGTNQALLRNADPQHLARLWESSFFVTAFQNIENKPQFFFLVITFGHINKSRKITGALRRRVLYSPGFYLKAGEYKSLNVPLPIWPRKTLPVSYDQLSHYAITIDMWNISAYTFNTLYASATVTLRDVVDMNPDITLMLTRQLPNKKRFFEVHRLKATFQLSEVFDFDLYFESWSFTPGRNIASYVAKLPKILKFLLPKGVGQSWKVKQTDPSMTGFWRAPFSFTYRGTLQDLQNAYFVIKVYVKDDQGAWFKRPSLVGTALASLRSVTTYSLFRSMVKQLTVDKDRFILGEIIGNIRCFTRSTGLPYYEDPATVKRPVQPLAGAALVTQLDFREQFLVVRLFRCENLPPANLDAGTSDPVVRVKWDGMTNTSTVKPGTLSAKRLLDCRPVWNQNLYFPVRLLDPRERTLQVYIQSCLPLDLLSKGPIVFECWDQDETSSDFLGGCEFHLSDLIHKGKLLTRRLAEGLGEYEAKTARMPDGRPVAFQYQGDETEPEPIEAQQDFLSEAAGMQPYEVQYSTLVFTGNGIELTGGTIATGVTARPLIFFEVFCIPPLPRDLDLPAPLPVKEEQDLWKQWSRRWERDFNKWLHTYAEWFPTAPTRRRFICTTDHPQTRRLHPLPAFVVPIAVPEQISDEGELLHWISNMTFLVSTKQNRTGIFSRWLSPNYLLITRKGGINDHAVLLCSCLLGLDYDAYICKGTINDGNDEHCWVMTRHPDGWVVFWETTNKKRYHLPARWGYPPTQLQLPPMDAGGVDAADGSPTAQTLDSLYSGEILQNWYFRAAAECGIFLSQEAQADDPLTGIYGDDVVPDIRLEDADVTLDTWDKPEDVKRRAKNDRNPLDLERMQQWMQSQTDALPIAPKKNLCDPTSTLCYVPYSSIEVVFNGEQLWGNLQNHHPAMIYYDLADPYTWRPFLTEKPTPIDSFIFIAPSTRDKACDILGGELQADTTENIRVLRNRRGLETQVDHGDDKSERLDKYLDLLEFRLRLDPEYDPGPPPGHQAWSSWGAYESVENTQDLSTEWYSHLHKDPQENTDSNTQWTDEAGHVERAQLQAMAAQAFASSQAASDNAYSPQPLTLLETKQPSGYTPVSKTAATGEGQQHLFQSEGIHQAERPSDTHLTASPTLLLKKDNRFPNNALLSPNESLASDQNTPSRSSSSFSNVPEDPKPLRTTQAHNRNSVKPHVLSTKTLRRGAPRKKTSIRTPLKTAGTRISSPSGFWDRGISAVPHAPDAFQGTQQQTFLSTAHFGHAEEDTLSRPKGRGLSQPPGASPLSSDFLEDVQYSDGLSSSSSSSLSLEDYSSIQDNGDPLSLSENEHQSITTTEKNCPRSSNDITFNELQNKNIDTTSAQRGIPIGDQLTPPPNGELPLRLLSKQDTIDFERQFERSSQSSLARTLYGPTRSIEDSDENHVSTKGGLASSISCARSPTVNRTPSPNQEHDALWTAFSTVHKEAHQKFRPSPEHTMIMDDYEDFESTSDKKPPATPGAYFPQGGNTLGPPPPSYPFSSREASSGTVSPTPGFATTSSQPSASPRRLPDDSKDSYYKVFQKPVKTPAKDDAHGGGLDIETLGFTVKHSPGGAVVPAPDSSEGGKDVRQLADTAATSEAVSSFEPSYGATDYPGQPAPPEAGAPTQPLGTALAPQIPQSAVESDGVPPPQVFRRPIFHSKYQADQTAKWNYYYRMEGLYYQWQKMRFPVRPSHTFCGFPVHFSTTDTSDIRSFLLSSKRFRKIIEIPVDGITYVIRCKIFPLMGGVVSCWLFIGCEIQWAGKQQRRTRMKRPRKARQKKKLR